jgi:hypothetical protein
VDRRAALRAMLGTAVACVLPLPVLTQPTPALVVRMTAAREAAMEELSLLMEEEFWGSDSSKTPFGTKYWVSYGVPKARRKEFGMK